MMKNLSLIVMMFNNLLKKLEKIFSNKEINEVNHFLEVNEYGLALDTLVSIFVEEKKIASPSIIYDICELTETMQREDMKEYWLTIANKLSRIGQWEFEDYRLYPNPKS